MTALTTDQRWLLYRMGGWQIISALCSTDGTRQLMNSRWGSTGGGDVPESAPDWLDGCGWDTEAATITPRWLHGKPKNAPTFTIKPAAINRYSAELPEDVKAELLECRNAGTANAVMSGRFCHCGSTPCGYRYLKDRICPPTEDQEQEARDEYWRIRDWQDDLLLRALGLVECAVADDGQLELFEVA